MADAAVYAYVGRDYVAIQQRNPFSSINVRKTSGAALGTLARAPIGRANGLRND